MTTHILAYVHSSYHSHNSYATYLLFRWLFQLIGGWAWLVLGGITGLGLWARLAASRSPRSRIHERLEHDRTLRAYRHAIATNPHLQNPDLPTGRNEEESR